MGGLRFAADKLPGVAGRLKRTVTPPHLRAVRRSPPPRKSQLQFTEWKLYYLTLGTSSGEADPADGSAICRLNSSRLSGLPDPLDEVLRRVAVEQRLRGPGNAPRVRGSVEQSDQLLGDRRSELPGGQFAENTHPAQLDPL